jgi:uncharacterized protein involved in oxidation of intracellular sulfur
MTYLIVLNDHPYESERNYNGLRLATALASNENNVVRVFLIGEAVRSAVGGQTVPDGKHDIEWMLRRFAAGGRPVGVCRTCMEARGIETGALIDGTYRSTLDELTRWTEEADKVLVF